MHSRALISYFLLATNHIMQLEKHNQEMQARLHQIEMEVQRLRSLNEKISLSGPKSGSSANMSTPHSIDSRPLSPPPEGGSHHSRHGLVGISGGRDQPREDSSPSASEGDY